MMISPWKKWIGVSQEIWQVDFLHDDQRSDPGFETSCGTHTREWCQPQLLAGKPIPCPGSSTMEHHRLIGAAQTRWAYHCARPQGRSDGTSRGRWMPLEFDCRDISEETSWHTAAMSRVPTEDSDAGGDIYASLDDEPSILTVGPIIVSHSQLGVLECLIIIAQSLLGTSPTQRFWIYIIIYPITLTHGSCAHLKNLFIIGFKRFSWGPMVDFWGELSLSEPRCQAPFVEARINKQ